VTEVRTHACLWSLHEKTAGHITRNSISPGDSAVASQVVSLQKQSPSVVGFFSAREASFRDGPAGIGEYIALGKLIVSGKFWASGGTLVSGKVFFREGSWITQTPSSSKAFS